MYTNYGHLKKELTYKIKKDTIFSGSNELSIYNVPM